MPTTRTIPGSWNPAQPEDFIPFLFYELSGLYEHRNRYATNPDKKIRERALVHFDAQIAQTFKILGKYTGWGELRAKDEYEKWAETTS